MKKVSFSQLIPNAEQACSIVRKTPVRLIELFQDGDQWCALLGANIQSGTAGFGDDEGQAVLALGRALAGQDQDRMQQLEEALGDAYEYADDVPMDKATAWKRLLGIR